VQKGIFCIDYFKWFLFNEFLVAFGGYEDFRFYNKEKERLKINIMGGHGFIQAYLLSSWIFSSPFCRARPVQIIGRGLAAWLCFFHPSD